MKRSEIDVLASQLDAEIIETHISWVLLTKDYAYKIKKPIRNSFLDFTSLLQRKYYCEEELKLNQELTPEIYLDVVTITIHDSRITIDTQLGGSVVDYAILMKRMDQDKELNKLLLLNLVSTRDVYRLATAIAEFHKKARPAKEYKNNRERIKEFSDLNNYQNILSTFLPKDIFVQWNHYHNEVIQFLEQNESLFKYRFDHGFVRDLHGDLHSGNIFILEKPVLFDRLEFNPRFRMIDVLQEVAFICMEFDYYDKKELGDLLFEQYNAQMQFTITEEILRLYHYYKSYCANIRAKVNCFNFRNREASKNYFKLMLSYRTFLK